jgi:hypothetical protein
MVRKKETDDLNGEETQLFKQKIRQLAECDEIVSTETINVIGNVTKDLQMAEENVPSSDEFDEDLEEEYRNLNVILDLPNDTYSLTEIKPELPTCMKYGVRSGLTHLNMSRFSPLSRGYQVIMSVVKSTNYLRNVSSLGIFNGFRCGVSQITLIARLSQIYPLRKPLSFHFSLTIKLITQLLLIISNN